MNSPRIRHIINIVKVTSEKLGTDRESSDVCVSSVSGTGISSPMFELFIGRKHLQTFTAVREVKFTFGLKVRRDTNFKTMALVK